MAKVFGEDKIRGFGMAKFISAHLISIPWIHQENDTNKKDHPLHFPFNCKKIKFREMKHEVSLFVNIVVIT
jgi:hypothetical protein